MKYSSPLILAIICFLSCIPVQKNDVEYSFFVAGHAYGNPNNPQYGIYPPLMAAKEFIRSYPNMEFGVLTGDVVVEPTSAYWDSAVVDISSFQIPIHIAAGNHDKGLEFEARFPNYYYSFERAGDLFIVLTPTNWNIENDQLEFLRSCLRQKGSTADNIFIFCHELIFWSPDNKFAGIEINWKPHFPGSTNYYSEVQPDLAAMSKPVYLICGDIGATASTSAYFHYQEEAIHYLGNGLGNGSQDNILIIQKNQDRSIDLEFYNISESNPSKIHVPINYLD